MMDTNPEYIKMCEKAEEIQQAWKPRQRDCFLNPSLGSMELNGVLIYIPLFYGDTVAFSEDSQCREESIWLPRQDQLQEMLADYDGIPILSVEWVTRVAELLNSNDIPEGQTSMEQLWLAFVMKEKYSKIWNGKEWVLAKEGGKE